MEGRRNWEVIDRELIKTILWFIADWRFTVRVMQGEVCPAVNGTGSKAEFIKFKGNFTHNRPSPRVKSQQPLLC